MREVCWDTETTGILPAEGHRIVEIACVEIEDMLPTGNRWHAYLNPQRDVPFEAFAVHGLSTDFLRDKPLFRDVADDFIAFIADSPLVAHNAPFDMGFINSELERIGKPVLSNPVVDTLRLARKRLGATARASLDALCTRFDIDLSRRIKHEAMLDCELLAQVYHHLNGGPHRGFDFDNASDEVVASLEARLRPSREIGRASATEIALHDAFLDSLRKKSPALLWDIS